ncbi:MAG TPA: hypothetical protein IAC45_05235 [Candidatus Aphodousia faecavium]|nr:hypothetical protein [Candidatus Aphodousia faecavium]
MNQKITINTDKAYLLGLIIGGGFFGNAEDYFQIKLPYKKWGSIIDNPQRAGAIAKDIVTKVNAMFRAIYNLSIQYEATDKGNWTILCEGDISELKADLQNLGIECEGELRGNVDLQPIIDLLVDDNLKRRFVAGLADTIGSMAKSQRRFTDEHQIISFEIKGYNFKFVCDLCRLLYSINAIPDQINWNHPNIHCTSNPYYKQWNKGFKLRILLDQYAQYGSFSFRTKAESSQENRKLQKETHNAEKCETRTLSITASCVHSAEKDEKLPEVIRNGHYIHCKHFCAVLGCEHAPYNLLQPYFKKIGDYVFPFPILCKAPTNEIEQIISSDSLLSNRKYQDVNWSVASLLKSFEEKEKTLMGGDGNTSGYPLSEILKGIAYVVAEDVELSGTRPKGPFVDILKKHIEQNPQLSVVVRVPELLTPLVIHGAKRSALIGARNPDVYARLVTFDENNPYKLVVRKITEEDLS